jgi:hypothetical protein
VLTFWHVAVPALGNRLLALALALTNLFTTTMTMAANFLTFFTVTKTFAAFSPPLSLLTAH